MFSYPDLVRRLSTGFFHVDSTGIWNDVPFIQILKEQSTREAYFNSQLAEHVARQRCPAGLERELFRGNSSEGTRYLPISALTLSISIKFTVQGYM